MLPCVPQNQINSNNYLVTLLITRVKLNSSKLNNFIKLVCCRVHIFCWLFSFICDLTFLSLYNSGAFDLLIYTDKDLEVPEQWEESGPQLIDQSEEVRLRSFTTTIHKVNSMVAYKRTNSTWFLFFVLFYSFLCFVFCSTFQPCVYIYIKLISYLL